MKTIKRILVLHGWNSNSQEMWFPSAEAEFASKGYEVTVPDMPGNYFPKYEEWIKTVEDFAPDEESALIGHSLGGVTILRYLEKAVKPVGQVVLVATPIECMNFEQIQTFLDKPFHWEKIKENAEKITLIYESDDPLVPLEHGERLKEKIGGELIVVPGGVHLTKMDMGMLEKIIDG